MKLMQMFSIRMATVGRFPGMPRSGGSGAEAFWNEVDKVMPGYLERKEWLKQNGAAMDV
jgi:hypothetical protein